MSTESDTEPDREPEPDPEQAETEAPASTDDDGEPTPDDHPESAGNPDDGDSSEESTPADGVPDEPPASFRATIQAAHLKTILSSLRALVDEARIRVTEDGLTVRAVDSANVAMDDLELETAAFESFEASPGTLGLNLDRLADPVGLASKRRPRAAVPRPGVGEADRRGRRTPILDGLSRFEDHPDGTDAP